MFMITATNHKLITDTLIRTFVVCVTLFRYFTHLNYFLKYHTILLALIRNHGNKQPDRGEYVHICVIQQKISYLLNTFS